MGCGGPTGPGSCWFAFSCWSLLRTPPRLPPPPSSPGLGEAAALERLWESEELPESAPQHKAMQSQPQPPTLKAWSCRFQGGVFRQERTRQTRRDGLHLPVASSGLPLYLTGLFW